MKQYIIMIPLLILILALALFGGIEFEIWRWHTFQSVTHSKVGFWTYFFLFGSHR